MFIVQLKLYEKQIKKVNIIKCEYDQIGLEYHVTRQNAYTSTVLVSKLTNIFNLQTAMRRHLKH